LLRARGRLGLANLRRSTRLGLADIRRARRAPDLGLHVGNRSIQPLGLLLELTKLLALLASRPLLLGRVRQFPVGRAFPDSAHLFARWLLRGGARYVPGLL
jgi:hypothetical protein